MVLGDYESAIRNLSTRAGQMICVVCACNRAVGRSLGYPATDDDPPLEMVSEIQLSSRFALVFLKRH